MLEILYKQNSGNIIAIRQVATNFDLGKSDIIKNERTKKALVDLPQPQDLSFWQFDGIKFIAKSIFRLKMATITPEIPADGSSQATITIQKYKQILQEDNTIQEEIENVGTEEVIIKCTRGRLSALKLSLVDGQGSFTLTSVPETVEALVTVSVSGFECPQPLKIQFV